MTLPRGPSAPRIAILGAGPIGLEAALEGSHRGFDVAVYEAGRVADSVRRFEWVRLFTPFSMNGTERVRTRLGAAGHAIPALDAIQTAGELVARYLEPLTRLPELAGRIRERSPVTDVGREGMRKSGGIVAAGDRSRVGRPFLLRVEPEGGPARFDRADVVIDATGVYRTPRATGLAGLPALGEERLDGDVARHLPPIAGTAAPQYAGRRVLLVGDGHSAATALGELETLAARGEAAQVTWVRADRGGDPFLVRCGDPLPERSGLAANGNRIARSASWLSDAPGAVIESYERRGAAWRVTLRAPGGGTRALDVDRVLALVGYRPDSSIHRELQVHVCYASEAPMALASALLAASVADPEVGGDCLKQPPLGADSLKNPEPDFYIVGSKSYGRNSDFHLSLGHRQVLDVMDLIEASRGAPVAAARA